MPARRTTNHSFSVLNANREFLLLRSMKIKNVFDDVEKASFRGSWRSFNANHLIFNIFVQYKSRVEIDTGVKRNIEKFFHACEPRWKMIEILWRKILLTRPSFIFQRRHRGTLFRGASVLLLILKIARTYSADYREWARPSRADLSIILGPLVPFRRTRHALFDGVRVQRTRFTKANILHPLLHCNHRINIGKADSTIR